MPGRRVGRAGHSGRDILYRPRTGAKCVPGYRQGQAAGQLSPSVPRGANTGTPWAALMLGSFIAHPDPSPGPVGTQMSTTWTFRFPIRLRRQNHMGDRSDKRCQSSRSGSVKADRRRVSVATDVQPTSCAGQLLTERQNRANIPPRALHNLAASGAASSSAVREPAGATKDAAIQPMVVLDRTALRDDQDAMPDGR